MSIWFERQSASIQTQFYGTNSNTPTILSNAHQKTNKKDIEILVTSIILLIKLHLDIIQINKKKVSSHSRKTHALH